MVPLSFYSECLDLSRASTSPGCSLITLLFQMALPSASPVSTRTQLAGAHLSIGTLQALTMPICLENHKDSENKKFFFPKTIPMWNSLHSSVVSSKFKALI